MKKLCLLLTCLALLLAMTVPAMAVGGSPKIVDEADLLTSYEENWLEEKAEALAEEYGIDVVIVTVDDLDGKSATAYADDYFDYNGYGVGLDDSGVLFLISMEYRDWAISTHAKGIEALTDYGIDQLFDSISGYLADDEYYDAFDEYLNELDYYFEAYENGEPIDSDSETFFDKVMYVLFSLVCGLVVAGIVIFVMSRGMNTAKAQKNAQSYLAVGSYDLHTMTDIFLYSRTSKVRRAESSSSGGGSSTHRSSSGRSHGGRSGKF